MKGIKNVVAGVHIDPESFGKYPHLVRAVRAARARVCRRRFFRSFMDGVRLVVDLRTMDYWSVSER